MTIDEAKYGDLTVPIPVRHRRKVPFAPRLRLPEGIGSRLSRVDELDRELSQYIVSPEKFLGRVEEVVSSNLHSSVRLEGSPIDLGQVRQVTRSSLQGKVAREMPAPRREVQNHLAVWFMPEELGGKWTVETVTTLHRELLRGVDPKARPGQLRGRDSAIYSDRGEELFITAPPGHIPEELDALLDWLNEETAALSPLVAGAIFFHEFESIHPFEEGNGRTGRVLFHAYLQNHGLTNAYRCGIEAELLRRAELYYRVLSWTDFRGEYAVLVDYFTDAVLAAYEDATEWFRAQDVLRDLGPLARVLVQRAFVHRGRFDLRVARSWVPSRSEQTIRLRLRELVELGLLASEGRTRAQRYRFVDPLTEIRGRLAPLRQTLGSPRSTRSYRKPEDVVQTIPSPAASSGSGMPRD
jgi:Fic family protein